MKKTTKYLTILFDFLKNVPIIGAKSRYCSGREAQDMASNSQYSAFDIADYFLFKAEEEGQELLSNLKLQKLVYYAQGLYLVEKELPLFEDKIIAWQYGPVVSNLYHKFKHYGAGGIPADRNFNQSSIDKDTKEFLDGIFDFFGQYSAIRLMQLAHADQCYIDAGINNEITHEAMREDLKAWIKDG
jgi:uncharacterized phage-associated protein